MDQLDDLDGNGHNTNINHFTPIIESDYEEGTNPSQKPNMIPVIVLSEDEAADYHKEEHNHDEEEDDNNCDNKKMVKTNIFDSDNYLNGYILIS